MICKGCTFAQYPPCAIQKIYSASNIDDVIQGKHLKQIMHPVCHLNAQKLLNGKIERSKDCDNCGMCEMLCDMEAASGVDYSKIEKIIFSNLNRLNTVISALLPSCVVVTEAKSKGNAREKRVDLVIKKGSNVYLIKMLTDIDKYPYYFRSYTDIKKYYQSIYNGISFNIITLIPARKTESADVAGYDCVTMSDLISTIKEA